MRDEIELSRKVQLFKQSEFYEILLNRLNEDRVKYRNEAIADGSDVVRGKAQYIDELFNWFEATAKEELKYEEIDLRVKHNNDY
jgi:hypothetical protein